ncbi:MAG: TetR/AcrR family transcriptional regulator [Veillonellaceae bacterium]|nr:TetR/AcrR family transcriptional regulator [Veillonellaceae bacterium]
MDRRQQKTRTAIFRAFTDLLTRKSYARITVSEIIAAADVGRSTFYSHFETKDALLEELCRDLFGHIIRSEGQICTEAAEYTPEPPDYEPVTDDYRGLIAHLLYHITNRREAFLSLLRSDSQLFFLHYLQEHLSPRLVETWLSEGRRAPDVPPDYLRHHFAAALVATIQWWIGGGMEQTPEVVADYFAAVMNPLLQYTRTEE